MFSQGAKHLRLLLLRDRQQSIQIPDFKKSWIVFYQQHYWHVDHPSWSNMMVYELCMHTREKMIEFACFLGTLTHLVWTHLTFNYRCVLCLHHDDSRKKTVNLVFFRLTFKTCGCQDKSQTIKSDLRKCVPGLVPLKSCMLYIGLTE